MNANNCRKAAVEWHRVKMSLLSIKPQACRLGVRDKLLFLQPSPLGSSLIIVMEGMCYDTAYCQATAPPPHRVARSVVTGYNKAPRSKPQQKVPTRLLTHKRINQNNPESTLWGGLLLDGKIHSPRCKLRV